MEDLVFRLRKRAEIRRSIPGRKSVQNGAADRISDLLEEAAGEIERLRLMAASDGHSLRQHKDKLGAALGYDYPDSCEAVEAAVDEIETLRKDFNAHEVKEVQYHDTIHKLELEIEALHKEKARPSI